MNYTVKVFKFDGGTTKAFASVTFDNKFVVTGLKVMEGKNGLFVSMPSRKDKDGEYKDTAYPITKEFRAELIEKILAEYNVNDSELPFF